MIRRGLALAALLLLATPALSQAIGDREAFLAGTTKDCPGCDLAGVRMKGRDLSGANLAGADLTRAVLHRANLSKANLAGAKLSGANLNVSDLRFADFSGAIQADPAKPEASSVNFTIKAASIDTNNADRDNGHE